jgi:hypothetical protein
MSRLSAKSKAGLDEALAAYLKADRESGAGERRRQVLESGLAAQAEHEALLQIETSIEAQLHW